MYSGSAIIFCICCCLIEVLELLVYRSCRECLSEVYIPVMQMVFEAPPTSPLLEIDVGNMADFIIHLTRPADINVSGLCMKLLLRVLW